MACISLSFDYEGIGQPEEQADRVLAFLRGQGATFTNLMSNEETDVLYKKFKLAAVPAVFVYDREGQLAKRFDNEKAKRKEDAFTYEQVRGPGGRTAGGLARRSKSSSRSRTPGRRRPVVASFLCRASVFA